MAEQPERTVTGVGHLLDYQQELENLVMEVPLLLRMRGLQRWIRVRQL